MTKQEFQDLLDRYFNGIVSDEERQLIDNCYNKLQESEEGWEAFSEGTKKQLRTEIYDAIQKKKRPKEMLAKPNRIWMWKVAASIVIALGVSITYYLHQPVQEINYITKFTNRGQKATISLSDGSTVRLNSESSITYPESFASLDFRDIKLEGEAFFDIKRNPDKPFTIKSGDVLTTVLGTSFNISAFPEMDEIEVTVATGRVKVESSSDFVSELISGQQASYSRSENLLTVGKVDIRNYTAWKDGIILFDNTTIEEASIVLSRWYDVQFEFENEDVKRCVISGKFESDYLINIMENMRFMTNMTFEIKENKIVKINGKKCED